MKPKLVDIHCHLNFPEFDKDKEEVVEKTLANGVWFVNVGADLKTSKESVELADKYDGVFASVGTHPHYVGEGFPEDEYKKLVENPNVVAIGECGLDYVRSKTSKDLQKQVFKKHIELAIELNKPLMIHCRDAHEEVLDILKSYFVNREFFNGNVHFFTGNQKYVEKYLELDFTFSFTGLITYINDFDKIIEKLPIEKIMLETDAPFVAPVPYRGERSEPIYVKETAKKIAKIKNISFKEVAEQTTKNAIEFFGLK